MIWLLVAIFLGLGLVYNALVQIKKEIRNFMSTTQTALQQLQSTMTQLTADYSTEKTELTQILADIAKLVAGGTVLPSGQVAVNISDLQALTASAQAVDTALVSDTAAETAADATVNPPAPSANVKKA